MINHQEALEVAYLALASESASLKEIAYEKMVLWMLLVEDKPLSIKYISTESAKMLGGINVPDEAIEKALIVLKRQKLAQANTDSFWSVSQHEKEKIEKSLQYSAKTTTDILKTHFPQEGIDLNHLRKWFEDCNKVYFTAQADKLVKLYCEKEKLIIRVDETLRPIVQKHGLEAHEDKLIQGYIEFLTSEELKEQSKVFTLMSAILSTKLLSADVSPDLFSIDSYRGANIIIDTNVLFKIQLNKNGGLSNAFESFGRVLSELGANLFIADFTIEEHESVRIREREAFINTWNENTKPVIKLLSKKDDISKGIIDTNCETIEDIERFFDSSLIIPKDIGGVELKVLSGAILRGTEYDENSDKNLFEEVQSITEEFKGSKKGESTAIHDVRLTKLVRKLARVENYFVLTFDSAMEALALRKSGEKDFPTWRSFRSLIQILAINGGGPNFNPMELAPIFKNVINFEDIDKGSNFNKKDFLLLTSLSERVKELPQSTIISLLTRVHRTKFSDPNSIETRSIKLELERTLRSTEHKVNQTIAEQKSEIAQLQKEKLDVTQKMKSIERTKILTFFWIRTACSGILFLIIYLYLRKTFHDAISMDNRLDVMEIVSFLLPIIYSLLDYFKYTKNRLDELE
jgi:hypothetical protein